MKLPVPGFAQGERLRLLPNGKGLVFMSGSYAAPDFELYDFATRQTRLLARPGLTSARSFDIAPDGKQIVFDRVRENSDIVLIELADRKRR